MIDNQSRIVNIRLTGAPDDVAALKNILDLLLGYAIHLNPPRSSSNPKYAGSALARGTVAVDGALERVNYWMTGGATVARPVRYFGVRGHMTIHGKVVPVSMNAHADDLPEGDAAKDVIAERVRLQIAQEEGDEAASWREVEVIELFPSQTFDNPLP